MPRVAPSNVDVCQPPIEVTCAQTIYGQTGAVRSLDIDTSEGRLLCGGYDANCLVWDVVNATQLQKLYCKVSIFAVASAAHRIFCGNEDGHIYIFDVVSGQLLLQLEAHSRAVFSLLLMPQHLLTGCAGGTIQVRDLDSLQLQVEWRKHTAGVTCFQRHPTRDNFCFSGSMDHLICQWNLETLCCVCTFSNSGGPILGLCCAVHDADVVVYACTSQGVGRWGEDGATHCPHFPYLYHDAPVYCLALCSGLLFTGTKDGLVLWWDVATGEGLGHIKAHSKEVLCMMVVPYDDQFMLFTGSGDSTVVKWLVKGKKRDE